MTRLTLLTWLILSLGVAYTQAQDTKFSVDLGGGYTDAETFPGFNVDGQFTYIYKRWHFGTVLQVMNTFRQVNNPSEYRLYIIEAIPSQGNPFGYNYSSNWQRSQAHFGLLIGFDVIQRTKLRLNISAGYGYSRYRELRLEEYYDPAWPHLTFISRNTDKFDFNYGVGLSYDVYKTLFLGTRIRHVVGITNAISYNLFVGVRI